MRLTAQRGMTVPELIISFGILMLVLGFATVLFTSAFTHTTLTGENLTNEQGARIAMARINASLSQASVDANATDNANGTPLPAIINAVPQATATPVIIFYRVQTLNPAAIATGTTFAPQPNYNVHIISYDAGTGNLNEYTMDYQTVYKVGGASPVPKVLAQNVTDFGVMQITPTEYQIQITVNNVTNATQAEQPYTLVDNVHMVQ